MTPLHLGAAVLIAGLALNVRSFRRA